jgi:hypothetical protein
MKRSKRTIGGPSILGLSTACGLALTLGAAMLASSSVAPVLASPGTTQAHGNDPRARENLLNLTRTNIEIDINANTELRQVFDFLKEQVKQQRGAELVLEPLWKSDLDASGLDPAFQLPATSFKNLDGLEFLDRILMMGTTPEAPATWQLTALGAIQIGAKSQLNKFRRVELYNIQDLLITIEVYNNAPEIDLDRVLQSVNRGGGGGSGSPFRNNSGNRVRDNRSPAEKAQEVLDLIRAYVDPDQWTGGGVPEPRYWQGNIIFDCPDYLHRGINGYPWLPRSSARSTTRPQRFTSMTSDSASVLAAGPTTTIGPAPSGSTGTVGAAR